MKSSFKFFVCLITIIVSAQQPTIQSNNLKLKEIQEREKELQIKKTSDSLDEILKQQPGDPNIADGDAYAMATEEKYGKAGSEMGRQNIHQNIASGLDSEDVNQNAMGKFGESLNGYMKYIIIGVILFLALLIGKSSWKK